MDEHTIIYFSFVLSIIGLVLTYATIPELSYRETTLRELNEGCEGLVKVEAKIKNTFYSENSNLIAVISDKNFSAFLLLNDLSFYDGDKIQAWGTANSYKGKCWIFPDRTELIF